MKRRSDAWPPSYHWTSVSVAGDSSIRYSADSGASSASAHQHLDRRHVGDDQHGAAAGGGPAAGRGPGSPGDVRRRTTRRPAARAVGSPSHAASCSGQPSRTSSNVRPSHSPNAHSRNAVDLAHVQPRAPAATASAVWRVRRIGERHDGVDTAVAGQPLGDRRCLPQRPRPDSSGSWPPEPLNRFSAVCGGLAVPQQHRGRRRAEARRPSRPAGPGGCGRVSRVAASSASCAAQLGRAVGRRPGLARARRRRAPRWPAGRRACCARAAPRRSVTCDGGSTSRARSASVAHVRVLDLPAAGHLLDDELGVQPRLDRRRRVELADRLEPGDQPAVLRDVVARGADVLGDLAQHRAGRRRP